MGSLNKLKSLLCNLLPSLCLSRSGRQKQGAGVCLVKEMNSEVGFVWKRIMFRVDEGDEQWVGVGVCFPVGRKVLMKMKKKERRGNFMI